MSVVVFATQRIGAHAVFASRDATGGGVVSTSAAGRLRARGGCATTSIRAVAVTGRIKACGATTATSIRPGLATGRVKARGANSAAPIVAGTVVTAAAGRLRARGSSSSTTTRIVGEVGRLRLRGVVTVATIRPAAVGGRLRVRGHAAAGPVVGIVETQAVGRLAARGSNVYAAMPPVILVPAMVCISARQPAGVAIRASILACNRTD